MKLHSVIIVFLLLTGRLWAIDFPHQYTAEQLPTEALPAWRIWKSEGSSATVELVDNTLHCVAKGNERFCYIMGTYDKGLKAGAGLEGWDAKDGMATVDFRFRCGGDDAATEVFTVSLSDGSKTWTVSFSPTGMKTFGKPRPLDTTRMDTYRITLSGGVLQISSAQSGILAKNVRGLPGENVSNRILFGITGGKNDRDTRATWNLEFIRWTNAEADTTVPEAH